MSAGDLRVVLVTPETTVLDQTVTSVRFPLFDGQIGARPGRAPLVGRLGSGELTMSLPSGESSNYFIDGGFAQIKGSVISILTNRAMPSSDLTVQQADAELEEARSRVAHTDEEFEARQESMDRARRMRSIAQR